MAEKKSSMKSLKAYEEIRDKILIGEKLPGTRLILSDLEAEMGIGRGLIREAFIRPWTLRFHITPMPYWAQRILGRRRGAKWHYAAPPPDGQWARPEP